MDNSKAKVVSVNISPEKGMRKKPIGSAKAIVDFGLEADAHAANWHRQISLLAQESIDKMVEKGLDVTAGDFAENVTTQGIDLVVLPIGTRLRIGDDVVVEVTQIGKKCHSKCEIYRLAGDCVMPREGIFVKVIDIGTISVGDEIEIINGE